MDTIFTNEFSKEIWETTYKHHSDNSIFDTWRRVSKAAASVEKTNILKKEWEEKFYDLLLDFKVICGGRILSNAGTEWNGTTLINCYTGGRPKYDCDSLKGILQALYEQSFTLKSEGGFGLNFSWIRPRTAFIQGIGVESPGSVKYMELFDKSSDVITAGSNKKSSIKESKGKIRKGAQMGINDCWHPDILEFITAKQTDNRLSKFNMSVNCSNQFMDKVILAKEIFLSKGKQESDKILWDLIFPETTFEKYKDEWDGDIEAWKQKGYPVKVYQTLPILDIWNLIIQSTYNRNEPGVLFLDRANERYNFNYSGLKIRETNACVTGDTELLTQTGYQTIESLCNQTVTIWNGFEWTSVCPKATNFNKQILEIELSDGRKLKCTDYHEWIISKDYFGNFEKKSAINLKIGDKIQKYNFPVLQEGENIDYAYSQGFISGDGMDEYNYIWIYEPKFCCINRLNGVLSHSEYETCTGIKRKIFRFNFIPLGKTFVPLFWNLKSKLDWIAGLFDADGCELTEGGIQLVSIDKNFLFNLQKLLSLCGVNSKICFAAQEGNRELPDGKGGSKFYFCQNSWRICIGAKQVEFLKSLGLHCNRLLLNKTPNRDASQFVKIVSIKEAGVGDIVYCFNEPIKHLGCFNGIVTGQCSEQTMPPYSSCNLLSINLVKFLTKDNTFDFNKLEKYSRIALRFSDNINDLTYAPLPEYEKNIKELRRVGIGILGWASLLYILNIRFASDEAETLKKKIMSKLCYSVIDESTNLAQEKGKFVGCDCQKHANINYFSSIQLPQNIKDKILKFGVRNSSFFSIQPTGNTSCLANIVSGGCEPIFLHEYIRTKILQNIPEEIKDKCPKFWEGEFREFGIFKFFKEGDEQILKGHYNNITYKIDKNRGLTKEILCEDYAVNYLKSIKKWNPKSDWAITTNQLSVDEHIKDLNGFAYWLDASCSKTINIPNNYSFEKFEDVYLNAYKSGLIKGITTYREGTMTSVLSKKEDSIIKTIAPKRPKELSAEIFTLKYKKDNLYVAIGFIGTDIYEVFAGFNLRKHIEKAKGKIIKNGRGKYIFVLENGEEYDLSNGGSDENADIICRLISSGLRHGTDISFIVHQLEKTEGDLTSFSKVIARVLKKYIKDGTRVSGEECPECGQKLIRVEGCKRCSGCQWTAC